MRLNVLLSGLLLFLPFVKADNWGICGSRAAWIGDACVRDLDCALGGCDGGTCVSPCSLKTKNPYWYDLYCDKITGNGPPPPPPSPIPPSPPPSSSCTGVPEYVRMTGYSYGDNDPPNSDALAYPDARYPNAMETAGKMEFPTVIAVNTNSDLEPGAIIYIPKLRKYAIVKDFCAGCGAAAVDVWMGPSSNGGAAAIACMNRITADNVQILKEPSPDCPVNTIPMFDGKSCTVQIFDASSPSPSPSGSCTQRDDCPSCCVGPGGGKPGQCLDDSSVGTAGCCYADQGNSVCQ